MNRQTNGLAAALAAGFCLAACAAKHEATFKPPYPFEKGQLPVAVALLSTPEKGAAAGLGKCLAQYEGLALLAESQIYAILKKSGLSLAQLAPETRLATWEGLEGIDLFLLLETGERPVLQVFDRRRHALRRLAVGPDPRDCEKLLATLGYFRIASKPPAVDTFIDGRYYGRTPLYTPLPDGKHTIELFHPKGTFGKQDVFPPAEREVNFLIQLRDDKQAMKDEGFDDGSGSGGGKWGMAMMIIGSLAVAAASIVLPIYFAHGF
jgi:hypothetical protein